MANHYPLTVGRLQAMQRRVARKHQDGAVLLVGLIILLVLTLIGTSGLSTVTLEERMVSNMQNANKAFQGSEAALAECEDFLRNNDYDDIFTLTTEDIADIKNGTARVAQVGDFGAGDWWDDAVFWANYGADSSLANITKAGGNPDGLWTEPSCVIEYIGNGRSSVNIEDLYAGAGTSPGDKLLYRVTANSMGADTSGRSVVESMFTK